MKEKFIDMVLARVKRDKHGLLKAIVEQCMAEVITEAIQEESVKMQVHGRIPKKILREMAKK